VGAVADLVDRARAVAGGLVVVDGLSDAAREIRVVGVDARVDDRHGGVERLGHVPRGEQTLALRPPLHRGAGRSARGRLLGGERRIVRNGAQLGALLDLDARDAGMRAKAPGQRCKRAAGRGPDGDEVELRHPRARETAIGVRREIRGGSAADGCVLRSGIERDEQATGRRGCRRRRGDAGRAERDEEEDDEPAAHA